MNKVGMGREGGKPGKERWGDESLEGERRRKVGQINRKKRGKGKEI